MCLLTHIIQTRDKALSRLLPVIKNLILTVYAIYHNNIMVTEYTECNYSGI